MNEILDIRDYLKQFIDTPFIYIPNSGNCGDCLISYSTFLIFEELGLTYTVGNCQKIYNDETIIYGGGGNLVGLYSSVKEFLNKNSNNNSITMLPHTVCNEDEVVRNLLPNVTVFCREPRTYNYIKSHNEKIKTYLSKDMALYFNPGHFSIGCGILNAYRQDVEKTSISIPEDNVDLSWFYSLRGKDNYIENTKSKKICEEIVKKLIKHIAPYEIVNTNRLHVCILSSLMGKQVYLHNNSYWKNEEVYNYSLKDFDNIQFIKDE